MINELVEIANHLDSKGLRKEADYLDAILKSFAQEAGGEEDSVNVRSNTSMRMEGQQAILEETAQIGDSNVKMIIDNMRGVSDDGIAFTANVQIQEYEDPGSGNVKLYSIIYSPERGREEVASAARGADGKKAYYSGRDNTPSDRNRFMDTFRKATRNVHTDWYDRIGNIKWLI